MDFERVLKTYDTFDAAHNRVHALAVLKYAIMLGNIYLKKDIVLVKIAAIYHDIGLLFGRDGHEAASARYVLSDKSLSLALSPSQVLQVAHAVKQHRASNGQPRTLLAKIISDADRASSENPFKRSYEYQREVFGSPHAEALTEAHAHLSNKYSIGMYGRRTFFPETEKTLDDKFNPIIESDVSELDQFLGS